MQIYLSLRRSGDILVYGLPLWYRISSAAIAAILAAAATVSGGLGVVGNVIVFVAILAPFYQERWTFNAVDGSCSGRIGLVFAAKGPSFKVVDIARIRIDIFARGRLDQGTLPSEEKMPAGSQARLIVDLKDGKALMIDSVPFKRGAELAASASAIAGALGVQFEG
ncbi:MAG: hypothetical protein CVV51_07315 [Spirochaetae bacterium HGW-Spirochaetae-7]|jgi:hypothetical protein|nr:MAG: hypothetical protein CVV51_07315 [Spirochaetae bacterium HGW-Spirochaetae-7]